MIRRITLLLTFVLAALPAYSYPQAVHKKISTYAFDQAARESDFLQRYGWADIGNVLNACVGYGAVHQDDGLNALNHFYDPQPQIPLTVKLGPTCNTVGIAAPDWALEINRFDNPGGRKAAQHQFLRALTATARGDRTYATFSLFEDLGEMTHLIQDMAQPEHTRNDQHLLAVNATAPSLYENWSRDHLMPNFLPDGTPTSALFEGYPTPPVLGDARQYFEGFYGLASYSTYHHVTQDTNYSDPVTCARHGSPRLSEATPRQRAATVMVVNPLTGVTTPVQVVEEIYTRQMYDVVAQRWDVDGNHTILSAVDHEARKYGRRVFSLDDWSWQSRAVNLVPKAVAYTAAMIKSFFRGRVHSHFGATDAGTYRIRMMMPPTNSSEWFENATVYTYRETASGNLEELAPPTVVPIASFGAFVAEIPASPEVYRHGVRVVVQGLLGRDAGAIAAHIMPPRHEMKLVVEYEPGYTHKQTSLVVRGDRSYKECNCSTAVWWPALAPPFGAVQRGIPFSNVTTPPFPNGKIELTVASTDSEAFLGSLSFFEVSEPTKNKTAHVTLYRDGAVAAHQELSYKSSLLKKINFDGAGTLTITD